MNPIMILLCAQIPPDMEHAASLLAPSPVDFDRILLDTTNREEDARAIAVALARVQNALAEHWARSSTTSGVKPIEPIKEPAGMLALEPVLLRDHRDAVQSLRASIERLERITEAPTVSPVVFGRRSERVKELSKQTREQVRVYSEMFAWHERFVRPQLARMKEPALLEPGPGWPRLSPLASDDRKPRTAIVGIGGGTICPDLRPADGTTIVLRNEAACYGGPDCTCIAVPVFPGAVLGRPGG